MLGNKKRRISLILLIIILTTAVLPLLQTTVKAATYTVDYHGKIKYGATTVGKFYVNGVQAFCMDHKKTTPAGGTVVEEAPYNDDNILKTLYYGWGGDAQWGFTSEAQGIVYTTLALDHFKNRKC